ncbi:zinc-ribbon domain-containing protein [Xanthomonas arboricola]|uniref:zinc-ribbon domain-containing protein n=1 Tax=Xanthomonas arboricola TaxID=56448 RepID=UPI000F8E91CC|nr:zinc-ribbon domain-containing protein [Xanthomonas arboricola]
MLLKLAHPQRIACLQADSEDLDAIQGRTMALVTCEECGRSISDRATACPGCGAPARGVQPIGHTSSSQPVKASLFARLVMWAVIVVAGVVALLVIAAIINTPASDPVADAQRVIDRQLASDLEHVFDTAGATHSKRDGKVFVCSTVVLNRPGNGPLAMDNVRQRVIVTMFPSGAAQAIFDGSTDVAGRAEFAQSWGANCG